MNWERFWNDSSQVTQADFAVQVGRTFQKAPYSKRQLEVLEHSLLSHLEASPDRALLDLGCGNGLVTSRLAPHFKRVTGLDFSRPLIEAARTHFHAPNVRYLVGSAIDLEEIEGKYERVLLSAVLQHISPEQAREMFRRLATHLSPGARVVLSDVADGDRTWNFYRGVPGRWRYAVGVITRRPIIGYWWKPSELLDIALEMGWALSICYQSPELPNHYFRYDAILQVPFGVAQKSSG